MQTSQIAAAMSAYDLDGIEAYEVCSRISRLKIAGADHISWVTVDEHIVLLFASTPGQKP
jgi:hypothetical protein